MKITAFRIIDRVRGADGDLRLAKAEVDVTTGWLWWRKTETRRIYAARPAFTWCYLDTGEDVKWTNC